MAQTGTALHEEFASAPTRWSTLRRFWMLGAVVLLGAVAGVLALAGVLYGLALYVVNFQIFGNTVFPWFTNPAGPNQGFEVGIHAAFGLMLVPFFLGAWRLARRQTS